MSRDSELTTMRRRMSQRVRRMSIEDCRTWWAAWVEANRIGDATKTGELTSVLTGCCEPSRSQNIRGAAKRAVYDKIKKAGGILVLQ